MTRPPHDLSRLKAALNAETQMRYPSREAASAGFTVRNIRFAAAAVALTGFGAAGLAVSAPLADQVAAALASKSEIDLRVGRNGGVSRVELYGSVGSRASVRSDKGQVVIRLPGAKTPDIGDFRVNPPTGVKAVDLRRDARASEIVLTLDEGAKARFGRSDGAVFVQIDSKDDHGEAAEVLKTVAAEDRKAGELPPAPVAETKAKAAVPVVALKQVRVQDGVQLDFPFPEVTGAAVFRRGEAVWMVFDREVDFRLPAGLKDGSLVTEANWVKNDGFTALRLVAPSATGLSVDTEGATWRVRVGGRALNGEASEVAVKRDDTTGSPTLTLNLAGAKRVAWIRDPMVGDRMAVIPAPGPAKAVRDDRSTLQASIAATAQGVMVERMTPDIMVTVEGDRVAVTRPGGLLLSSNGEGVQKPDRAGFKPALFPTLPDPSWSQMPEEGFLKTYNRLQEAAAEEQGAGAEGPYAARLDLARFLIGQGMNFEAQGVLDLLTKNNPRSLGDPQVRGLKVVAKVMAGRLSDAQVDLDSTALQNDPAANLWRGYIAERGRHYEDARKAFAEGVSAMEGFPPEWRTRFATANARAALALKDTKAAWELIVYAAGQDVPPLDRLEAQLVQAEIIEAQGDKARAYRVYAAIAKSTSDRINAPAQLRAARLKLELGEGKPEETLQLLSSLRFRWRGDETELETIRTMADIYLTQGRYRQALEVLRGAGASFFNRPDAVEINEKLSTAFRSLFLDGMADGLQPIEALGLYFDFKDLTPVGGDGDAMVRRMVKRLVEVDLLSQAADLLQYQIDNRLQGVARSQMAADLAAIHLMNRQPEKALQALWKTRNTLLPKAVLTERRVLEARALNELNRPDHALEVLGNDMSPEALDVRADILWRQKDWAKAGALLERRLADRWKKDGALAIGEEANLIRAGVAYSLASDQKSLDRLSQRFGKYADTAQNADAVRVALAGLDNGPLRASDFATAAAQTDSFTAWVAAMKQKFRTQPAQPAPAAPAAPAPKTA
ncbi:MAG: tetratricopeptide repeat protein [Asticcacaulis sp.]|uniref:tetratricopeptide repeat protein n=1 Tax=Asticcacaulis sp. TaxID=1872648 RepID=UPI0025B9E4B2|nr:tetratricopeptide repeat protein [Asticcacaulis sp.]MCA1935866.1 tetratricopeptide repeat protein [Asticcacaulis sp.]